LVCLTPANIFDLIRCLVRLAILNLPLDLEPGPSLASDSLAGMLPGLLHLDALVLRRRRFNIETGKVEVTNMFVREKFFLLLLDSSID
jgi:hypothetical protein